MELGGEIQQGFALDLEGEAARKIIRAIEKWRRGGDVKTGQKRWPFELMQNALDVSRERGGVALEIWITSEDDKSVTVKHNAGYFTPHEIRALVYAYSTKPYERVSEFAGKFATGFLVTHIVSRRVGLKGVLRKGDTFYSFETVIDRSPDSIDEIHSNFTASFGYFNNASVIQGNLEGQYWTEYTYQIMDGVGQEAGRIGVSEIKRCLPFLFAFNAISKITINGQEYHNRAFSEDAESTPIRALTKKEGDIEVAVAIDHSAHSILDLSDTPRVYIKGLPLIKTGDYLRIPFTMHSAAFETREDRDTLTDGEVNIKLVKKAFSLYFNLADEISRDFRGELASWYLLADCEMIAEEYLRQNPTMWKDFNTTLKETMDKVVEEIPLVRTIGGWKAIANVVFPSKKLGAKDLGPEAYQKFYRLLGSIKNNIPVQDELEAWIGFASKAIGRFEENVAINLHNIGDTKEELAKFGEAETKPQSFDNLQEKYGLSDGRQFLMDFFGLVDELYSKKVIDSPRFVESLLPDQEGVVGGAVRDGTRLAIDEDIPDDLKNILHRIGWEIRKELLHKDFGAYKIVKDLVHERKGAVDAIKAVLNNENVQPNEKGINMGESLDDNTSGWIELFRWSVANRKVISNFPVITKENKVQRLKTSDAESFLVPFKYIGIREAFERLYPASKVLHKVYFEIDDAQSFLDGLKEQEMFITTLPLRKRHVVLKQNKLQSIIVPGPAISKTKHQLVTQDKSIGISVLPLWREVIGSIVGDQDLGKLFFRFVVEYLIKVDRSWEQRIEVNCMCRDKSHTIIPSRWLASLKTDAWVPVRIIDEDEERIVAREATKATIEQLFLPSELEELIVGNREKIAKLLSHFGFDELDLKTKLQSIEQGRPEEHVRRDVCNLMEIASVVPGLQEVASGDMDAFKEAVERLKERAQKEQVKNQNRKIGENVEIVIRRMLKGKGLKVVPVFKGGDMEIWPEDTEGWDSGVIEMSPYLMEVKFTSGKRVHLSKAQSEMCGERQGDYIVLVVENVGGLRERLNTDIAEDNIPEGLVSDVVSNSHVVEGLYNKLGSVPNPEEVEPDIHGYWLKKRLWENKSDIRQWIKKEFGHGS